MRHVYINPQATLGASLGVWKTVGQCLGICTGTDLHLLAAECVSSSSPSWQTHHQYSAHEQPEPEKNRNVRNTHSRTQSCEPNPLPQLGKNLVS